MSDHPGGARARNSDRWDTSGRIYERDGRRFTSVTTILGDGIPKPALIGWAKRVAAEWAVAHPGATIKEIKAAPDMNRDEAGQRGTDLHKWAERHTLDPSHPLPEQMTDEQVEAWNVARDAEHEDNKRPLADVEQRRLATLRKMVDQWLAIVERHSVKVDATEFTIYNETLGYAGTADGVAMIDGIPTLFDIKTGKDVYPEAALQLCALAHGEYIGIHNGPTLPMPEFERCVVVHVRPTFARIVPVDVGEWSWRTFRAARAISEWTQGPAKAAILPAIVKEE